MSIRPYLTIGLLGGLLACLWSGCGNNIGRLFDPDVSDPGQPGASTIQRMVPQGNAVDGRIKVRNVFPSGNGWPGTVPIVVEFSETVNEASVVPQTGTPNLFLQIEGSGTAVPAVYDFLFGSRVVVIRPATQSREPPERA